MAKLGVRYILIVLCTMGTVIGDYHPVADKAVIEFVLGHVTYH